MSKNISPEQQKAQDRLIGGIGFFMFLFLSILFTVFCISSEKNRADEYFETQATILELSDWEHERKLNTKTSYQSFNYYYSCTFLDRYGKQRYATVIDSTTFDYSDEVNYTDGREYWRGDTLTIFYANDFEDGDIVDTAKDPLRFIYFVLFVFWGMTFFSIWLYFSSK